MAQISNASCYTYPVILESSHFTLNNSKLTPSLRFLSLKPCLQCWNALVAGYYSCIHLWTPVWRCQPSSHARRWQTLVFWGTEPRERGSTRYHQRPWACSPGRRADQAPLPLCTFVAISNKWSYFIGVTNFTMIYYSNMKDKTFRGSSCTLGNWWLAQNFSEILLHLFHEQ